MVRSVLSLALVLVLGNALVLGPQTLSVSSSRSVALRNVVLKMSEETTETPPMAPPSSSSRLGSSIDQDGKSNIWAVEPKMQVQETTQSSGQLVAVGIGAVLALVLIASSFLFINVEQ